MTKFNSKTGYLPALFGVLAILLGWFTILLAIYLNPWFHVTVNALSDLGGKSLGSTGHPYPNYPFVYNGGLMITGLLIGLFSLSAIGRSTSRVEIVGFSFLILAGIFLFLVGVFHEGTYQHVFLAEWFFLLGKISFLIIGVSLILGESKLYGTTMFAFNVIAWIIEASIRFRSVAENEIYGIIVLDILIIMFILHKGWRGSKTDASQNFER
ncbi:MAG: DUF998 domain-containing protein [Candidatus Thermoplasmatota archaeon]|nr:DUF998 domain-containing protein [Candidatus Thermoplasmatota archaeon]MDA8143846.1 DUF998 domain-containing protein [Thermoplasmatales archaeon]